MVENLDRLKATANYNPQGEVTYTTPSLREFADTFNAHQISARKAKQEQNYNDDMNLMGKLYDAKLNSQDHYIANESDKSLKKMQVAYGIKEFYNTNYEKELDEAGINFTNMTNEEVIDWYTELNPNSYETLKSYVQTPKDINNPLELYSEMGWLPTVEEERLQGKLNAVERMIADTTKNFASGIDETYIGLRNFVNGVQGIWDDEANYFGAFQNYAHDMLGKDVSMLSDLEIYGIQEALKNKEIYDDFKPTPQKALTTSAGGVTDTMFTIAAPGVKYLLSMADADPLTNPLMSGLTESIATFGNLLEAVAVPLELYRMSLTDADKKKFDIWVGSLGFLGGGKKYGGKVKAISKDLYRNIFKKIGLDNIIKGFEDNVLKPTNLRPVKTEEVGEGGISIKDDTLPKIYDTPQGKALMMRNKTAEDMYNQAAKIGATTRAYENKKVSDALAQIGENKLTSIKSYPELYNEIRGNISYIGKLQDSILDTFSRTVTNDNSKVGGPIDWGNGIVTEEYDAPIDDYIKFMEDMGGNWLDRSVTEAIKKYYEGGKLTTSHLYKMKRLLNATFRKFKKGIDNPEEVKSFSKRASRISEQLTQIAREMINKEPAFKELGLDNVLTYTDELQSANLYTRDLIGDVINKINRYNRDIPNSDVVKETGKLLGNFLSVSSGLRGIANRLEGPKKLTPVERQTQLNSMLRKWNELYKKLDEAKSTPEIEKVLEKFNKEYQKEYGYSEGPIEGEVFDPTTWDKWDDYDVKQAIDELFEVVDSENIYPESRMLNENKNYNGQEPIDYTTPTRVTPEGYAGRYGQTLESWKQRLRNGGMEEENINKYIDNIERNGYKYKQEPVINVIEQGKLIEGEKPSVLSKEDVDKMNKMKEQLEEEKKKRKAESKKKNTLKKGNK